MLTEIDLKLSNKHDHPDIKTNADTWYLAQIDGRFFAGRFSRVWFGLSFSGWYAPLQFDAPERNGSGWERLWRIEVDAKARGETGIERNGTG